MRVNLRIWIRVAIILVLLFFMYLGGLPLSFIIIFGIIIIILIILRGKLYRQVDKFLKKHFKFMSKIKKPWLEKLIIIVVFVIVYLIFREVVYLILGLFGIDLTNIQHVVSESINQSLNKGVNYTK